MSIAREYLGKMTSEAYTVLALWRPELLQEAIRQYPFLCSHICQF